jgi:hypothetical protein
MRARRGEPPALARPLRRPRPPSSSPRAPRAAADGTDGSQSSSTFLQMDAGKVPSSPDSSGAASSEDGDAASDSALSSGEATAETKAQICFDFTKGMCTRADKCKFSHDIATIVNFNSKEKGICFDYLRNQCHRGLLCRFSHDLSNIAQQCQVRRRRRRRRSSPPAARRRARLTAPLPPLPRPRAASVHGHHAQGAHHLHLLRLCQGRVPARRRVQVLARPQPHRAHGAQQPGGQAQRRVLRLPQVGGGARGRAGRLLPDCRRWTAAATGGLWLPLPDCGCRTAAAGLRLPDCGCRTAAAAAWAPELLLTAPACRPPPAAGASAAAAVPASLRTA